MSSKDLPRNESSGIRLPVKTQVVVTLALFTVVLAGGWLWSRFGPAETKETEQKVAKGTFRPTKRQWDGLRFGSVQKMSFRTEVVTEGSVAYNDDVITPVFSPFSGRVTRVIAKPGEFVKKGEPLMAVAASEFVQAQSDLKTARAQATLAAANEQRQHELFLAKSGALKDWLQSQGDLATAEANLRAVRNRLIILGRSDEEIRLMESNSYASDKNSSESLVLAPISGSVVQRQVGVGQYISSAAGGATNPVYTIGDLSTVWLVAYVRETDAPLIRIGLPVEVMVSAYPGRIYKAKIIWVAPNVDPASHRIQVRAVADNADGSLKAQMFASFKIMAGDETPVAATPQSAIVFKGEEAHAFVARDDGTIELREIKTGRMRDDGMVEITAGLSVDEKIVTGGTLFIDRATTEEEKK